jgi:DNA polymerase I-like protein with 3'-5' exonuclease and polymerase domains
MFSRIPGLKTLIDGVKRAAKKRKYLRGLDGRKLFVRSEHAALNTLLQSAGALSMKQALIIFCRKMFLPDGIDPFHGTQYAKPEAWRDHKIGLLLNVHDEFQVEAPEDDADAVGQAAADSIKEAGEYFGLNCPLAGEYQIGDNWQETH